MKKEDVNIKIAERIIYYRKLRGLSQEGLGSLLDMTRQNIQEIESGKRNPGAFLLRRIAKAFEITLSELLKGV